MRRCIKCKVPLNGILGKICAALFKTGPVRSGVNICNRCQSQRLQYDREGQNSLSPAGKYRCQICERDINETAALAHIKTEEYLIALIKKDHPEWAKDKKTCQECLDYYRRLIKEAEI